MISMYSCFIPLVVYETIWNFWVVESHNLQMDPLVEKEGFNIFTAGPTGCHKTGPISKTEKHSTTDVKLSGGSVV